jgi:hypothetical protein
MFTIQFKTAEQVKIANMLWSAETMYEVEEIVLLHGHDGLVVYHMILAATYDEITDTDLAEQVIAHIKQGL